MRRRMASLCFAEENCAAIARCSEARPARSSEAAKKTAQELARCRLGAGLPLTATTCTYDVKGSF